MALPVSYFSDRSQRGLLALAGPAATMRIDGKDRFVARFVAVRYWLLQACLSRAISPLPSHLPSSPQLAVVLQRTAVEPQPHCDSGWIPTDRQTGHRGGHRGHWYISRSRLTYDLGEVYL